MEQKLKFSFSKSNMVMEKKRKKVLCIDSDPSFLTRQQNTLRHKNLENCFFGFNDFWEAYHFIEKQIITQNKKLHYILLDEKIPGRRLLPLLGKISALKNYLKKPEVIVCTSENNNELRNKVMQFPVVSAFLVKPVPQNYIEFLITGQST
ncbi:MAG: hypothetical protein ACP5D9_03500 [Mariniphaga sp.]